MGGKYVIRRIAHDDDRVSEPESVSRGLEDLGRRLGVGNVLLRGTRGDRNVSQQVSIMLDLGLVGAGRESQGESRVREHAERLGDARERPDAGQITLAKQIAASLLQVRAELAHRAGIEQVGNEEIASFSDVRANAIGSDMQTEFLEGVDPCLHVKLVRIDQGSVEIQDHSAKMARHHARAALQRERPLDSWPIIARRMDRRTERDLIPGPEDHGRRRFMIAGDRVILRALEQADLERCWQWMNDPNIVRTLKGRYPMPFHGEAEWLERAVRESSDEKHFAVESRDVRHHIGNASLHDIDWVSRTAAFGLFIGEPSAWNRGFGSDAIRTLARFAFDEMNLRKLRINVFDYNEKAKHVLGSLGFVQEGKLVAEFYREGSYHDIVILSIFRDTILSNGDFND